MAYRRTDAVRRMIAQLPAALEKKVLVGAARAAATVIATEARERVISEEVRGSIKISARSKPGQIIAKVQTKGPGAYIAPWLEYGTAPHFISVDDSQRQGMSVKRINAAHKEGSLVIGSKFVGTTVHHPGARPHPFMRPALDTKESEAIAAAQGYIGVQVAKGVFSAPDPEPDE